MPTIMNNTSPPEGLDDFLSDNDPQSAVAAKGLNQIGSSIGNSLAEQYQQGGQQIHQALQGDPGSNPQAREALLGLGQQAAMSTVGKGEVPNESLPKGFTITHKSGKNPGGVPTHTSEILDPHGNVAAYGEFEQVGNNWEPQSINVNKEHQRKGLATFLYNDVQDKTGQIISPSDSQTPEGRALWNQRSRPFGWDMSKMDENSRLARADNMGFDTTKTYYHGTSTPFEEFKIPEGHGGSDSYGRGIYVSESPEGASAYAPEEGGHVLPVHVKSENPFEFNEPIDRGFINHLSEIYDDKLPNIDKIAPTLENWQLNTYLRQHLTGPEVTDALKSYGYDSIHAPDYGMRVLFDPSQIRSKFAEFNPKKAKSGKLSYAQGGEVAGQDNTQMPAGLNEFLSGSDTTGNEPPGLDQFLAPSDEEKYGTLTEQAKAGLEGAAQGAIGPIAPAAEEALGVDPKDIRGRAEANPGTHTLGEIAGFVAPALISGGSSLAARAGVEGAGALATAAKFTQAGALKAIGEKLGLKGGETLASKIGVGAATAAIDNMLLAGSDEASKLVLKDPNQSAQTALVNIGLSGLIGAGAGAAFGATSELWKKTQADKAGEFVKGFVDKLHAHSGTPVVEATAEAAATPRAGIDPFTKEAIEYTPKSAKTEPIKISRVEKLGAKAADEFISRGIDKSGEAVGAGVGGFISHLLMGDPTVGAIVGAKALGPFFKSTIPGIAKSLINKIPSGEGFKAATDYATAVFKGNQLMDTAAKGIFTVGSDVLASNLFPSDKDRSQLDDKLKELQTDITPLLKGDQSLSHYMEDHSQALAQTSSQAVSYLNGIRASTDKKSPLDSEPVLSTTQKSAYKNALNIAQQPLIVMDKIKQGTLTLHDIQHLQSMYPGAYQQMQQKVMNQMIETLNRKETIPYNTRIGLSMFMGHPLDSSMSPQSITAAQPIQNQQQPMGGQQTSGNRPSAPALQKLPDLSKTPSQSRQQRDQLRK